MEFRIGQQVLIRKVIKKKNLSSKLLCYYYGPYEVLEKLTDVNYVIQAKRRNRLYRETVHVEKMKPYHERGELGDQSGELIEEDDELKESAEEATTERSLLDPNTLLTARCISPDITSFRSERKSKTINKEPFKPNSSNLPRYNLRTRPQ
jgi:hypothetical protein